MIINCVTWNLGCAPPEFPGDGKESLRDAALSLLALEPLPDVVAFQELFFKSDLEEIRRALDGEYVLAVAPEIGIKAGAPWPTWPLLVTIPFAFLWQFRQSGLATFVRRKTFRVIGSRFWQFASEANPARLWEGDGYADKGTNEVLLRHIESGLEVVVANTHVQAEYTGNPQRHRDVRAAQLLELSTAVEVDRSADLVLVLGDLNSRPDEVHFSSAFEGWTDLTLRADGSRPSERSTVSTDRSSGWIDYALARSDRRQVEPIACDLLREIRSRANVGPISDHYGVRVSFRVNGRDADASLVLALAVLSQESTRREWLQNLIVASLSVPLDRIFGRIDS